MAVAKKASVIPAAPPNCSKISGQLGALLQHVADAVGHRSIDESDYRPARSTIRRRKAGGCANRGRAATEAKEPPWQARAAAGSRRRQHRDRDDSRYEMAPSTRAKPEEEQDDRPSFGSERTEAGEPSDRRQPRQPADAAGLTTVAGDSQQEGKADEANRDPTSRSGSLA